MNDEALETMMRPSICAILLAAVVLLAVPVAAQMDTSKPIPVRVLKPKLATFKGEVLNATVAAITVRSRQDERTIRTFTYSDEVRVQILQIIEKGGYQYGDKVVIRHEPGSDVALRIKGKPSKPL